MRQLSFLIVTIFAVQNVVIGQVVQKMIDDVRNKPIYSFYSQHATNLNDIKIKSPIIEEINLRTETDQNNLARQEYALRTFFNAWGLTKVYQQQKDLLLQKLEIEKEEQMQKDLFMVYNDAVRIYFLEKKESLLSDQNSFNQRKLDHLIRIIGSGADINAKEVLRLEEDIYKSTSERALIGESLKSLLTKYGISGGVSKVFSLEEIVLKVNSVAIEQSNTLEYKKSILEDEENRLDFSLERKDARRFLDYAQLRYSRRDNLLFQDEFSLGLGLRLPYKGSLAIEKTSFMIKKMDIDYKSNVELLEKITKLADVKRKFNSTIEEVTYFQKAQDKVFATLNSSHPEVAEEISYFKEDLKLNTDLKLISLEEDAWRLYLEILLKAEQITPNAENILGAK